MADDIPTSENDTPPADEPEVEATKPQSEKSPGNSKIKQFFHRATTWYKTHLKIAIPLTVLTVVLLILAVPALRYNVLGLFLKKNFTLQVVDGDTKSPVSGASVSMSGVNAQTDGDGKAVLRAKVGKHTAQIIKKYYTDQTAAVTVPVLNQKNVPQVMLEPTGRQVKITIVNTITKKPAAKINITVADIKAQTDSSGNAMVVLPPGVAEQKATLSADGYNEKAVTIKVSDTEVAENKLTITTAGKIYFLSKRTGKIDVMKSNLDGTDQKLVLAGTGSEDDTDTILLASRDWKYLALKSKRDGGLPKLYYIDTTVDKLNTLDEGNAEFTMIGWSGNTFVYQVNRHGVAAWQPNQQALKSFNATTSKLTMLNQTSASGTDIGNYAHEIIGSSYIIDSTLVFDKYWTDVAGAGNGKQSGIYQINVDGSGLATLKSFTLDGTNTYWYIQSGLYEPKEIYYAVYSGSGLSEASYYEYENGSIKENASIKDEFNKLTGPAYPIYLLSPSGKQTFWVEPRDGKKSFLLGDQNGGNEKEIAKLDEKFQNYGYYTDDYLLISKNSSEIYVMPNTGVKAESELIKITDYHKPAYYFYGYGGGYGGL